MLLNKIQNLRSFCSNTIFSLSSGKGKCAISIIRISGSGTRNALKKIANTDVFKPRLATLKELKDPVTGDLIDKGLVIYFETPKSYTGEDLCELHVHGGISVVSGLLSALGKIKGLRPAEPGEFSRRAFYSGKLDLLEIEGIADLIHAESEFQRKQALIQANGHLSKLYNKWRVQIIKNTAHLEAYIDFSEDDNIEDGVVETVVKDLQKLEVEIRNHLNDGRRGERLRDGVRAVILGETNVGKSSLMNILCQNDVSIVTNQAGTTRDVIEKFYNIGGYPIILSDTAGLRESNDIVESEGILRAKNCAELADFIILVMDGAKIEKYFQNKAINIKDYTNYYLKELGINSNILDGKQFVVVVNKIDLVQEAFKKTLENENILGISCTKAISIPNVITEITNNLKDLCGDGESPVLSQTRHRHNLQECLENINIFLDSYNPDTEQDLAILVQNLRNSIRSIGRITGQVRTDDILDVIFKDFCIGK
ncbi:unnamed protein product [Diamesa tonsa]